MALLIGDGLQLALERDRITIVDAARVGREAGLIAKHLVDDAQIMNESGFDLLQIQLVDVDRAGRAPDRVARHLRERPMAGADEFVVLDQTVDRRPNILRQRRAEGIGPDAADLGQRRRRRRRGDEERRERREHEQTEHGVISFVVMSRDRFFIEGVHALGERVALAPSDARKIVTVLRRQSGDGIEVIDAAGNVFTAVLAIDGKAVAAELRAPLADVPIESASRIVVAQAIPKGQKMDFIVEKATELGVSAIVPLRSERVTGSDP